MVQNHKNIVKYIGFCKGSSLQIVTEYVKQGNLEDLLFGDNRKNFTIWETTDLVHQIANGMSWFVFYFFY